jgi:hypothetical protein
MPWWAILLIVVGAIVAVLSVLLFIFVAGNASSMDLDDED